jgi:hypothetical protein
MKSIRILIATFLVVSVTACTARYIRQAQDEFSRGAQLENAAFVRGYDIDFNYLAEDPTAAYRISLSLVNRELKENESDLRQDKLYGTALMLKAMCLWRLASNSGLIEKLARAQEALDNAPSEEERARAEKTLENAKKELTTGGEMSTVIQETKAEYKAGQIVLGERDLAMLNALPGLRDHDLALQAKTYEDAERFFKSALDVVEKTAEDSKLVSPGSQMGIYLRLAMLSTCRAWHFAAYSFHADDLSTAKKKAEEPRNRAKNLLKKLEPLAKADKRLDKVIKQMKARMGI